MEASLSCMRFELSPDQLAMLATQISTQVVQSVTPEIREGLGRIQEALGITAGVTADVDAGVVPAQGPSGLGESAPLVEVEANIQDNFKADKVQVAVAAASPTTTLLFSRGLEALVQGGGIFQFRFGHCWRAWRC